MQISPRSTNVCLNAKAEAIESMNLSWKNLSNKQKTIRTAIGGGIAIAASLYWFDEILLWERGRGYVFLAASFIVAPLQTLFFGMKWLKE
ncbi:hypothetical protein [Cognatiyoonia sediminum]|uniref:hypothetical protein n=1 Tax=Cognatiyoonia sediminum TaxID=1508389 RepID=UPI0010423AF9|nr:hypothetical protein [Cognatiyoonia sediminum]